MEHRLDVIEDHDGAVGATSTELALLGQGGRETDGVVEGETEGLMDFLAALAAVKEVLLDVLENREQRTASRVCRCIFAVRASDTARQST